MLHSFGSQLPTSLRSVPNVRIIYENSTLSTGTSYNYTISSGEPVKDRLFIISVSGMHTSLTSIATPSVTLPGNTVTTRIIDTVTHTNAGSGSTAMGLYSCQTDDGGGLTFTVNFLRNVEQVQFTVYELLGFADDAPTINPVGSGTTFVSLRTDDIDFVAVVGAASKASLPVFYTWNTPNSVIAAGGFGGLRSSAHAYATKFPAGTNTTFIGGPDLSEGCIGLRWAKKKRL